MFRKIFEKIRKLFAGTPGKTFRRERGDIGEKFAAKFLKKSGLKILLRNWRHGNDEIDLVALEGDCLVFVEVKTRAENDLRGGYAAVDARKRTAQKRAIAAYLNALKTRPRAHRFDVVEVFVSDANAFVRAVHHRAVPLQKSR